MFRPDSGLDSITDSVTGLPDSRVFTVVLERKIALARRTLKPLSIIYFEVENFDSFAPYIQEHALRSTSRVIANSVRESDTICGLGHSVLAVVLDDTSEAGAIWAAESHAHAHRLEI